MQYCLCFYTILPIADAVIEAKNTRRLDEHTSTTTTVQCIGPQKGS